jgi:hypothetical protein
MSWCGVNEWQDGQQIQSVCWLWSALAITEKKKSKSQNLTELTYRATVRQMNATVSPRFDKLNRRLENRFEGEIGFVFHFLW